MAPSPNHLTNIALIGATGNVGTHILSSLLASPHPFNITLITRPDSKVSLPSPAGAGASDEASHVSNLTILRGAYTDPTFLATAFTNIDCAIFALGFMAMDAQSTMIEAAVRAGVRWILPTEYAGDGAHEGMVDAVPLFWPKREARRLIERLGAEREREGGEAVKWIGVATNPWLPMSVRTGMFGVDPYAKKATLYADAGRFNVSSLPAVGEAVAKLLALPLVDEQNPRRSLAHYANGWLYVSSASTTQQEIFAAALKATGTSEAEWEVSQSKCQERLRVAQEKMKAGDWRGGADATYAVYMGEGLGGDYEDKARSDREVLGLTAGEGVEQLVREAVEMGPLRMM